MKNKLFQPDRISSYFRAEWLPLLLGRVIDQLTAGIPLTLLAVLLYFGSLALEGPRRRRACWCCSARR